jgi:TPR repeat protein
MTETEDEDETRSPPRLIRLLHRLGFGVAEANPPYWSAVATFCGVIASLATATVALLGALGVALFTMHSTSVEKNLDRIQHDKFQGEENRRHYERRADDDANREAADAAPLRAELTRYALSFVAQQRSEKETEEAFLNIYKVDPELADRLRPLFARTRQEDTELQDQTKARNTGACGDGDGKSCFRLAVKEPNLKERARLYEVACDSSYAWGCNNLGDMYFRPKQLGRDLAAARKYFGKACTLGLPKGCLNYELLP